MFPTRFCRETSSDSMCEEVGDPLGEERALELMAKLRAAQGKMDGALEAGPQAEIWATPEMKRNPCWICVRQVKSAWQWCPALQCLSLFVREGWEGQAKTNMKVDAFIVAIQGTLPKQSCAGNSSWVARFWPYPIFSSHFMCPGYPRISDDIWIWL